jgi:hypothetical protein
MPSSQPLIDHPIEESIIKGAHELEATENGLTTHRLPGWSTEAHQRIGERFAAKVFDEWALATPKD